jgi:hypothetical protein
MKLFRYITLTAFIVLTGVSLAGQDEVVDFKIAIAHDDGDGAGEMMINLSSSDMGFNMRDMQEGETRSIVDESGRNILVTRTADGFDLNVDGKTIELPDVTGGAHGMVWVDGEHGEDVDVQVLHEGNMTASSTAEFVGGPGGITILSGEPIDGATQEGIKSLLMSAGHSSEVVFVDRESAHSGVHGMKVVTKNIEVTQ